MHRSIQQLGAVDNMPIDLVEFSSTGRVLVIGSAEQTESVIPHLEDLQVTTAIQTPDAISGWLGRFKVELDGIHADYDLILDLLTQPVITSKVKPLGYFAPQGDGQQLAHALQQLPDLIGTFDKPRFFEYNASICAHSRRQVEGCSQCLNACPADAISSTGDSVSVNPSLCQGCGSCTAVCPSGAMSYALPTLDVSVNRIRLMLNAYFELESVPAKIIIHDDSQGQLLVEAMADSFDQSTITFSIEEIGALGMPFWLTALSYGAANITVWDAGTHSDHDWLELQNEISKTNQLLLGMGYPSQCISWFQGNNVKQLNEHIRLLNQLTLAERAHFAGVDDKRRMISMALTHLHKQAPSAIDVLALNHDAAFGEIQVDTNSCTLCMSCVSVCPVGAVLDGVDKPQLNFVEDLCVQCGMCQNACPEQVITLNPQYVFDREQVRKVRMLHQEAVFNCISCDKPFATQKMIETMTEKLKDHAMFQGPALDRLKMCEDCRVKAMFKDAQGPM